MVKRILLLLVMISGMQASQYDYLLFSNVYGDVRRGIELGADVDAVLRGSTPLYDASRKNNMDILNLLIKRGADVNEKSHGETPLHKVVQFNNIRFAKVLLDAGARVNVKDSIRGNTPLHYAVSKGNQAMINLLLDYGADMDEKNDNGDTPARFILSKVQVPPIQLQNEQIAMSASAFKVGNGRVAFSVRNLTNEYVTIKLATLYVNGDDVNTIELNKVIPPQSTINQLGQIQVTNNIFKSIDIDKKGVARVKYGFALKYLVGNSKDTLYDTREVDLQVWR